VTARATLLLLLAALAAADSGEGCGDRLAAILASVDSDDPDVRLRARRAARELALAEYRRRAPEGMRLVAGRVEISSEGVVIAGGFYLGEHEVTVREFDAFRRATGRPAAAEAADPRLPMTGVSLEEARAYAAWKGARLPFREELERAATAGGTLPFPWGVRFEAARANTAEAGIGAPEPVGSRPLGTSREGIADLVGNVAEWTESSVHDGARRRFLAVGGSYRKRAGRSAGGVTYRLRAEARLPDVGFRLAAPLPELPGLRAR
jgi:hypothetical protein